jgi:trans-aconitate methyltransferase
MADARQNWNPELYQSSHSFVWELARDLLGLLAPQAGEHILDIGCGTGQLAAEMARSGAVVTGIDSSLTMVAQARANFPGLRFELADVRAIEFREEFDGAFSNAALHWVRDADGAVARVARALKPRGRFVVEFGGRGNAQALVECVYRALAAMGVPDPEGLNPWYFPSVAEYAAVLERNGLEVTYAALIDRPTALPGGDQGLANWVAMFGECFSGALAPERRSEFAKRVEELAAGDMRRDGSWIVPYRRLRAVAIKNHPRA